MRTFPDTWAQLALSAGVLLGLIAIPIPRPLWIVGVVMALACLALVPGIRTIPDVLFRNATRVAAAIFLIFYFLYLTAAVPPEFHIVSLTRPPTGKYIGDTMQPIVINVTNDGDDATFTTFMVTRYVREAQTDVDQNAIDLVEQGAKNKMDAALHLPSEHFYQVGARESQVMVIAMDRQSLLATIEFAKNLGKIYLAGYVVARSANGLTSDREFCAYVSSDAILHKCPTPNPLLTPNP